MKIDELIKQGRKAIESRKAALARQVNEERKKNRAKAEEIFQSIFSQQDELAGIEYQVEEINGYYYAVIWDHDPGVAVGSDGRIYRLDWVFEDLNGEIVRVAVEQPGSLAEVLANVAEMPPSREQAEINQQKARKWQDDIKTCERRGFCPFTQQDYCVGPRCQLWVDWQGMDACAIKALVFIEMRRDGHVDWSEQ